LCLEPPLDCNCDTSKVDSLLSNTNSEPFPVVASCTEVDKPEPWSAFCDANSNGVKDDGEASIEFTMHKKCKKIVSGDSSIDCGSGEVVVPPVECNCDKRPKDCPECDFTCVSVNGKNIEVEYTCPAGTTNAGQSATLSGKCKKMSKQSSGLDCSGGSGGGGGGDTGLDCNCASNIAGFVSSAGGNAKAECIEDSKKPTYILWCDDNNNGEQDSGESAEFVSGKCKKMKSNLNC